MLTEGDRALLNPCLRRIHAARAALPEAERAVGRAREQLAAFRRDTTVWDRWFNRDSPTGLAYREARKVLRDALASVARERKQIEILRGKLDLLIGPMMPRLDRHYETRALVIATCARALRECRVMRVPIDTFVRTVRDATKNGRDENGRRDAAAARLRYPGDLVQARKAIATVKQAVEPVRDAAARVGIRVSRLEWDDAAFNRLPRTAGDINALQSLVRALPKIQGMPNRLDRLRAQLTGLRRKAVQAQRAAQISARDRLIEARSP